MDLLIRHRTKIAIGAVGLAAGIAGLVAYCGRQGEEKPLIVPYFTEFAAAKDLDALEKLADDPQTPPNLKDLVKVKIARLKTKS